MFANNIIIVPETHWDREWYLTFQEFRAKLVIMMDKLLDILRTNPDYNNFTLDGQIIPLEDYLEVRPDRKEEITKYVKEGRLSIGPMYVLPDEFLVSGESLIRNLMLGIQIGRRFGKVMKAGYIPDPFGHIAQLPQILQGFEIPSVLFWRGFGNEFEERKLNMEFSWIAPGKASSILAIHLIYGYGSVADINNKNIKGEFKSALRKIKNMVKKLERYIATPNVLLNNGSDHREALLEIPEIVKQWNIQNPKKLLEQADFEYYIKKVIDCNPELKEFQGELRGGRYGHLLSGVFSTRMWIKQRNTEIEYLYEKYTEPISTITWVLDKYKNFNYPKDYILTGLKWLLKNAPHDSICGCSIDEVHNEMITRFDWAEQIANEVFKNSSAYLSKLFDIDSKYDRKNILVVYNPLPWKRKDIVEFQTISRKTEGNNLPHQLKLVTTNGSEVKFQYHVEEEEPRFQRKLGISHKFTFLAEVPGCGYRTYCIIPGEPENGNTDESKSFKISKEFLENQYYKIEITSKGLIHLTDKKTDISYQNICRFEDMGDWGDEYDFSGPNENQNDIVYTSEDASVLERSVHIDGPTQKTFKLRLNLKLPHSLTEDRHNREEKLKVNKILLYVSLYKGIKRIDFSIEIENNSRDHRIRCLFPTNIKTEKVDADGHFYVVSRNIKLPKADNWVQKPLPTNHQKDFVSVSDNSNTFAILNRGLPEYEAILNTDGTVSLAVTLLRCVEWLSRDDFQTRKSHAGPGFNTPGAQCLGNYNFSVSIITESKSTWLDSEIHLRGKEFNNPLKIIFPNMSQGPLRMLNKVMLSPSGIISYFNQIKSKNSTPYLSPVLSFLEIDNKNIMLSAMKKSEVGNSLIIRIFNISSIPQKTKLKFFEKLIIKKVLLVNFLEETPKQKIKAEINRVSNNILHVSLEPHVITTFKIEIS